MKFSKELNKSWLEINCTYYIDIIFTVAKTYIDCTHYISIVFIILFSQLQWTLSIVLTVFLCSQLWGSRMSIITIFYCFHTYENLHVYWLCSLLYYCFTVTRTCYGCTYYLSIALSVIRSYIDCTHCVIIVLQLRGPTSLTLTIFSKLLIVLTIFIIFFHSYEDTYRLYSICMSTVSHIYIACTHFFIVVTVTSTFIDIGCMYCITIVFTVTGINKYIVIVCITLIVLTNVLLFPQLRITILIVLTNVLLFLATRTYIDYRQYIYIAFHLQGAILFAFINLLLFSQLRGAKSIILTVLLFLSKLQKTILIVLTFLLSQLRVPLSISVVRTLLPFFQQRELITIILNILLLFS